MRRIPSSGSRRRSRAMPTSGRPFGPGGTRFPFVFMFAALAILAACRLTDCPDLCARARVHAPQSRTHMESCTLLRFRFLMDPVTHGITGALLGKGYFSERYGRVAVFAATLGAVFPDIDVTADIFSRDPLAIVKYHRAITHSWVALPVFAFLLALLTRLTVPWLKKRSERFRDIELPPLAILTLIYGIGIASHIVLDGMTSFGTRMWYPISSERVAWDYLFIIDLTFMAILLLPQMLARIYSPTRSNSVSDLGASRQRAWR